MKNRRRGARRFRADRRWSEDRRTEEMLRIYSEGGARSATAQRYRPDEPFADGIAAPDRRSGFDRRRRRRRSPSDRRQLDDPAFVALAPDPAELAPVPDTWSADDFAGLQDAMRAELDELASVHPPESWSRERDYLYRTVQGWSHTVQRLARAVLAVLDHDDIVTSLSLMYQLRERTCDLCLLSSLPEPERIDAAIRALLFQALGRARTWPPAPMPAVVEHAVKELKTKIDRHVFVELEDAAEHPERHWSGLGRRERLERTAGVSIERLAHGGLSLRNVNSFDLFEVGVVDVAPNFKDYRPATVAPSDRVTVALLAWDWLRMARTAIGRMLGVGAVSAAG